MKRIAIILLCIARLSCSAFEEAPDATKQTQNSQPQPLVLKEEFSETKHTVKTHDGTLSYKATAGNLLLKDDTGKTKASIFFVAYTKDGIDNLTERPITFCFNGGPGSSAIWLHMGVFGPKRVELDDSGCSSLPYRLVDNQQTILNVTDLVFIDPVSTGYSRAAPGEDAKKYHSVEGDIKSVSDFIRLYATRYNRWASPKFIAGESYGTTRAAGLVGKLQDSHYMHLNGVILISSVLNFQTLYNFSRTNSTGNDLPYILYLPSYTAAAWYHKKLPADLQGKELDDVLAEAEHFAVNDYGLILLKGDDLTQEEKENAIKKLARYTGLSPEYIARSRLRVDMTRFAKELLRDQGKIIGRFDCRVTGYEYDKTGCSIENDPSADGVFGGFAAIMNYYLRTELKCEKDEEYVVLGNVWPWNFSDAASNQYLNVADTLRDTMIRNPQFRTFVASGYFDLATPYFATDYTVDHLGLDSPLKSHVTMKYYDGGHMMYTTQPAMDALGYDLEAFIHSSCPK